MALYQAACEVAPEHFKKPDDVESAPKNAEKGELFNVKFLVRTILDDLNQQERNTSKPARIVLLLDESGQWIEDSGERLSQLQALVEVAAEAGCGKIWVMVTTHEDMGSIYQNAKRLEAQGDFNQDFRFGVLAPTSTPPPATVGAVSFILSIPSDPDDPGRGQLSLLRVRENPQVAHFE